MVQGRLLGFTSRQDSTASLATASTSDAGVRSDGCGAACGESDAEDTISASTAACLTTCWLASSPMAWTPSAVRAGDLLIASACSAGPRAPRAANVCSHLCEGPQAPSWFPPSCSPWQPDAMASRRQSTTGDQLPPEQAPLDGADYLEDLFGWTALHLLHLG